MLQETVPAIAGYHLEGVLGQGAHSTVYRGARGERRVAVKVLRKNADDDMKRFRAEGAALARLAHPGVVRIVEVGAGELPFLAMELVEGESLVTRLLAGPLDEAALLDLAKKLVSALCEIHRRGLVHRDLKPANIVLKPDGSPVIIDFGFAVRESTEVTGSAVGTFLYGAPEQTGVLNRPVDHRADLYALGNVLYECAAGEPAFRAATVPDLLRMHAVVVPKPLHGNVQGIGRGLSAIVAKLLAKDPDDRYQTAIGLLHDLERVNELADERGVLLLDVGAADVRLAPEIPLVGRRGEMALLQAAWARAPSGEAGVALIEGEGGSGKSRLVKEIQQLATQSGALVLAAKAQEGDRTPLGTLRDAIDGLLDTAARRARAGDERLLTTVRRAAQDAGAAVGRLSRAMERLLDDATPLRPVDAASEQARFYDGLAKLVLGLASVEQPLFLVIDDVQWLDDGTLQILRRIAETLRGTPMMMACTGRNDAASGATVDAFVAALPSGIVARMPLAALTVDECELFLRELLGATGERAGLDRQVAEQLARRSNGNAFVLIEYVRSLAEQGVLRPTPEGWAIAGEGISDVTLPRDVLSLLAARVRTLSPAAQELLGTAAAIGFSFEQELLERSATGDARSVRLALEEAMRANLVEESSGGRYSFVHDRVREASLEAQRGPTLAATHTRIARALDAMGQLSDAQIFDRAKHYALADADAPIERVFATSFEAGKAALEKHSADEAFEHLERAHQLADKLAPGREELFLLHERFAAAAARTGRFELSQRHYALALERADQDAQRVRIMGGISRAYWAAGRYDESWASVTAALRMLGMPFPKTRPMQLLSVLASWRRLARMRETGTNFGAATGAERVRREAIADLMTTSFVVAWFFPNPMPRVQVMVQGAENAHFLGVHPDNAVATSWTAVILGLLTASEKRVRAIIKRLEQINSQLTARDAISMSTAVAAIALEMTGPVDEAQNIMRRNLPTVMKYGGVWNGVTYLLALSLSYLGTGLARTLVDLVEARRGYVRNAQSTPHEALIGSTLAAGKAMLGQARESALLAVHADTVSQSLSLEFVRRFFLGNEIVRLVEVDAPETEVDERIREFLKLGYFEPFMRPFYIYVMEHRLRQATAATKPARARILRSLKLMLFRTKLPPVGITATRFMRAHVLVVEAGIARLEARFPRAASLLAEAARIAESLQGPWVRFAVHAELARLHEAMGARASALLEARHALEIAQSEGWLPRMQRLRAELHIVDGVAKKMMTTSTSSSSSSSSSSSRLDIDQIDATRAVDAVLEVSNATSNPDPASQARGTLDALVKLLRPERAMLFGVARSEGQTPGALVLEAGRDASGNDLPALAGFASTIVERVYREGVPQLVASADDAEALGSESALAQDLRSILAVPLLAARDRVTGVLYLDSTVAKGLFTQDDLPLVSALARHIATSHESVRAARIEAERAAFARDLELTAAVQSMFLPVREELELGRVSLAGTYRAAALCSGDWWWFEQVGDEIFVITGDVTGHGAGPAMITALVATTFRERRKQPGGDDPRAILQGIDETLRDLAQGRYWMATCFVALNTKTLAYRAFHGGAPPVFIKDAEGSFRTLSIPSSPLGGPSFDVHESTGQLVPGELMVLASDGILEMQAAGDRPVGARGLRKLLVQKAPLGPRAAVTAIMDELDRMRASEEREDDMTIVMLAAR